MDAKQNHSWIFFRAGGLDQVQLERAEDLAHLSELDLKHWVALSCPVKNLNIDPATLELVDLDKDGKIRASEILAAVSFAVELLKDPASLLASADSLPLSAIDDSAESGKAVLSAAKRALAEAGNSSSTSITVKEADAAQEAMAVKGNPGTGLVSASSATDEKVRALIPEIVATVGAEGQRGAEPAVGRAKADSFFQALDDHLKWWEEGESGGSNGIMPLGEATMEAFDAFEAVRAKIEDYFLRCRFSAFASGAAGTTAAKETGWTAPENTILAPEAGELTLLPLQPAAPDRPLDLEKGCNPGWESRLAIFRQAVVSPLLGSEPRKLDESHWKEVVSLMTPHAEWRKAKKGAAPEALGAARAREILSSGVRELLEAEIAADLDRAWEAKAFEDLDRLARYNRDLHRLLRNFVNFADFYDQRRAAAFDAGRLYLDQRACHLCLNVEDAAKHSARAAESRLFLAYCECTRPGEQKKTIAAAITNGDADCLAVGRNGVFYDNRGRDWDAAVVKVIENPISMRQAFWAPYRRLASFIEEMVEKYGMAKDKAAQETAAAAVIKTAETAQTAQAAAPPQPAGAAPGAKPGKRDTFDIAKFAGIFAAIGLAIGAIGGALGAMLTAFASLAWWQMPLAIAGILLFVSGPSVLLAWLKLRLRNLGPLLEANGWAINGRVKINIPLGASLTDLRHLPLNARLPRADPFADKDAHLRRVMIVALLVVAATAGLLIWRRHDVIFVFSWLMERIRYFF